MKGSWLGAGLLLFAMAEPSAAQTVTGRVADSLSGKGLEWAIVYFDGRGDEVTSGVNGQFRIERKEPGDTVLVVRRIGYVPVHVRVPPSPSAAAIDVGALRLRAVATRLDRISVEAEEVRRYPQLEEFYYRKNLGVVGFFMTPDEISRASARKTSNLLERSSKVRTECNDAFGWVKRPGGAQNSPTDCTAKNSRPQAATYTPESGTGSGDPRIEHCQLSVWLDGTPTTMDVDDIPVRTIVGIEVYNGPATTPARFGSGHCGVVALWTKAGG